MDLMYCKAFVTQDAFRQEPPAKMAALPQDNPFPVVYRALQMFPASNIKLSEWNYWDDARRHKKNFLPKFIKRGFDDCLDSLLA
jgi:hypothetical protein